ncbi:MAG: 30S ribosomal protein S6 [Brevinema sp.]
MRSYEIAFLLRENEHSAAAERIKLALKKTGLELVSEDTSMGVRELAYLLIKNREKFRRAFYYYVKVQSEPGSVLNFENEIKYDQGIIRHMVVLD